MAAGKLQLLGIHCFYKISMITMELLKKGFVNCSNKPYHSDYVNKIK